MYAIICDHYTYGSATPTKRWLREIDSPQVQFFVDKVSARAEADKLNAAPVYLEHNEYGISYTARRLSPAQLERLKTYGF